MNNPKETIQELVKGCGALFRHSKEHNFCRNKDLCSFCQTKIQTLIQAYKEWLDSLELISSKYCSCDKCPSCKLFRDKIEIELKQAIEIGENAVK